MLKIKGDLETLIFKLKALPVSDFSSKILRIIYSFLKIRE